MHSSNTSKSKFCGLWIVVLLFFSCLISRVSVAQEIDIRTLINIRMLVTPEFEHGTETEELDKLVRNIPDLLIEGFMEYGGEMISIVGRENITKILNEIAFSEEMSGVIDSTTIPELKGLGANYYTTGKIIRLGEQIIVIAKIVYIPELTIDTCRTMKINGQDITTQFKLLAGQFKLLASQLFLDILHKAIDRGQNNLERRLEQRRLKQIHER
ncbi:MAG: hypothetical protein AB1422_00615 [bacterium]